MIILASQSPYRKSLMEKTGFAFKAVSPLADEEFLKKEFTGDLKSLIKFLAFKKAESLASKFENDVIVGSDQALILGETFIGKGHSYEGSKKQLEFLSGNEVELVTSVCVLSSQSKTEFSHVSKLKFKNLGDELIDWYLKTDEPYDCAGSFKMESSGFSLFESIENNDPTAIQGLPLIRLVEEFERLSLKRV